MSRDYRWEKPSVPRSCMSEITERRQETGDTSIVVFLFSSVQSLVPSFFPLFNCFYFDTSPFFTSYKSTSDCLLATPNLAARCQVLLLSHIDSCFLSISAWSLCFIIFLFFQRPAFHLFTFLLLSLDLLIRPYPRYSILCFQSLLSSILPRPTSFAANRRRSHAPFSIPDKRKRDLKRLSTTRSLFNSTLALPSGCSFLHFHLSTIDCPAYAYIRLVLQQGPSSPLSFPTGSPLPSGAEVRLFSSHAQLS